MLNYSLFFFHGFSEGKQRQFVFTSQEKSVSKIDFFSCRFVICWFNLKNVVAHKTNINLFKMSSEEDKPPAPPVRLTSTNRGKFNFKCIQFHTLGWNAISLECRNSIPYSFTRIINAKSKCASHIRINTYHIRLSAANLVLTFYVCLFFSLSLSFPFWKWIKVLANLITIAVTAPLLSN